MNSSSISQRDKKLLFFVGLFVISLLLIYFIIIPTNKKIISAKNDHKVLVEKQEKMEKEINSIPAYKKQLLEIDKQYSNTKNKVFNNFKEYDMDNSLTKLVVDNSLEPMSLQITSINGIKFLEYNPSSEENCGVISDDKSKIKAANISLTAKGPAKNVLAYLNSLDSKSGIFIQNSKMVFTDKDCTIDITLSLVMGDCEY